jgi:hypothetical protein
MVFFIKKSLALIAITFILISLVTNFLSKDEVKITFLNAEVIDVNCDVIQDKISETNHRLNVKLGKKNNNGNFIFDDIDYNIELPFKNISNTAKIDFYDFNGYLCGDLILIDTNSIATVFINKSKNKLFNFEESIYKEQS